MTKTIPIHKTQASPREQELLESIKHHGIGSHSTIGHFKNTNSRQRLEYEP
jgi:hypothetical protein